MAYVLADPQGAITAALTAIGLLEEGANFKVVAAKLVPIEHDSKQELKAAFEDWLLENYHDIVMAGQHQAKDRELSACVD